MAEIITFLLVVAAIIAVVGYYTFRDMTAQRLREDAEEKEWYRHRAKRQAVFDKHAQEVAHRVLIETCETIYIGRWQHEGQENI